MNPFSSIKRLLPIIGGLLFLFFSGTYLENSEFFSPLKNRLQNRSIPSPLLNFGKTGQIFGKLGLKYIVPENYSDEYEKGSDSGKINNLFQINTSRLTYRTDWAYDTVLSQEKMPSSNVIAQDIVSKGFPLLSIVIDEFDLYDKSTGIYANHLKKGRNWEKPCFISYYDKGELVFATGAGVRVHGGKKQSALRLYFRKIYGMDQFKPGVLFDKDSEPIRHLVVHDETRDEFNYLNILSYDISRKIGCFAPQSKVIVVYLNGNIHGNRKYALIEHLSMEFLISHFGHDRFVYYKFKGRKRTPNEYRMFVKWVNDMDVLMTMDEAEKNVNIENLCLWWISQLYSANNDIYQGLAVLDKSKPNSKWFWINWDMDHSIRNKYEPALENIWEQGKSFRDALQGNKNQHPRALLLRRLFNEDPNFREYFERLFMDVLNHRLTQPFLNSRINYYEDVDILFGGKNTDYIESMRQFTNHRHKYLRSFMHVYFGSSESYICNIKGPSDITYLVDGYNSLSNYKGWYFKGTEITVRIDEELAYNAVWYVNGKKIKQHDNKLIYRVEKDTEIEIVLKAGQENYKKRDYSQL